MKNGKGRWKKFIEGNQIGKLSNEFRGEYVNDRKNGYGEFKWHSGNIYKGMYKDDERDG
jgi:hypothetical protein